MIIFEFLLNIFIYVKKDIRFFKILLLKKKTHWLARNYFKDENTGISILKQYLNQDQKLQDLHNEFIENTISNFLYPLCYSS